MAASTRSSRRCARARSISWSSRSAPSGCRSRCATRCHTSALEAEFQRMKRSRSGTLSFKDIITRSSAMQAVLRIAEKAAASLHPGADRRRIRRRQGADRARDPRLGRAAREAVRCGQLRRDPGKSVESIAVRPREGRVHRRDRAPAANSSKPPAARCSSTRSANCRRPRRSSCCALCRRARSIRSARRKPVKVDVRVISATNRDLIADVKQRALPRGPVLSPARVSDHVPPLRERPEDIPDAGASFPGAVRRRRGQAHPRRIGRRARRC